jgi:hypothetical protein
MFENGYSYTDIEKLFPTFYVADRERINLLFSQKFLRKDSNQIEIIEKRRTLRKTIKRLERKQENEENWNIHSYKRYKAKKRF